MTQQPPIQQTPGGRAPKGGIYGLSGKFYTGGQFLPHSDMPSFRPSIGEANPEGRAYIEERERREQEAREALARQAAEVAQESGNVFVLDWLREQGCLKTYRFNPGTGSWRSGPPRTEAESPEDVRETWEFESGFLRDMHDELSLQAKRPRDLSRRQVQVMAEIYARTKGHRRGSRKYEAAVGEFYQQAGI